MSDCIQTPKRRQTPGEIDKRSIKHKLLLPQGCLELIRSALGEELSHRVQDAAFIVHSVWRSAANFRDRDGFWPLNFDTLRQIVQKSDCLEILTSLRASKIVVDDGYYIPQVKSTGYRLSQKMLAAVRENPDPFVLEVTDRRLHRAIGKNKHARFYMSKKIDRQLYAFLDGLEIDQDAAFLEIACMDGGRAVHAQRLVSGIRNRDLWYKPDFYGRRYTNVVCIHKELRKRLTWNGRVLVEIDIANSQPLCLAALLMALTRSTDAIPRLTKLINRFVKRLDVVKRKELNKESLNAPKGLDRVRAASGEESLLTMAEVTQVVIFRPLETRKILQRACEVAKNSMHEVARFTKMCEDGRFYEEMFFHENGREFESEKEKDDFKEEIFKYVFYGNPINESKITYVFRRQFPAIYDIIVLFKRPRYEVFACLMQHIESTFVIERAAKLFLSRNPGKPIFTVHDSFLICPEDQDNAIACMREAFAGSGVTPMVRRK